MLQNYNNVKLQDIKDVDEIAARIYELARENDIYEARDYQDIQEEEQEQLKNGLYYLQAVAQNEYNHDYFRVLYNALQCI